MLNSNIGALKARIRTGLARVTTAATNLSDLASIASPLGHICSVGGHVDNSKYIRRTRITGFIQLWRQLKVRNRENRRVS